MSIRTASFGDAFGWAAGPRGGKVFSVQPKGSGNAPLIADVGDYDTKQAFTASAWVKLTRGNSTGAVVSRMDPKNKFRGWDLWLEGGKVGSHVIHKWQSDAAPKDRPYASTRKSA